MVFELAGSLVSDRRLRRLLYMAMIPFTSFGLVLLLAADLRFMTAVIAVIALFRVLNAVRVVEARMREVRLRHAGTRSSYALGIYQSISLALWWLVTTTEASAYVLAYTLLLTSVAAGLLLLFSTVRTLRRTRFHEGDGRYSDDELPSLSICIPARNETEALSACLASLIKSDYPKLEILVLDDCSQDATSEIINGFARDGVRFIAGEPPAEGWLAKNQAYQTLAEAASGEILLFCGVDVRVQKSSLRMLISSMISRKKQMISLMPTSKQTNQDAGLLQPMRYWWELALPRRLFNRPPVLSTIWVISRQAFFGRGEMKSVKNSVIPEAYFARELARSDEYSFMRASGKLTITTAKQLPDQWQTAVRTRYPRLRSRPENVLAVLCAELLVLALPVGVFLVGFVIDLGVLWLLGGVATLILLYIHRRILQAWNVSQLSLALALFPLAILLELAVTLISMLRYEFSTVSWKQRDICIPVMQHYKHLPKI